MRYLKAFGFALFVWCFSFIIYGFVAFAVENLLYPALLNWFPNVVPEYNFVNEREKYEELYRIMRCFSAGITAIIVTYISVRQNNERFEYMITKTEGLYTVSEGAHIYYPRYIVEDLVASISVPFFVVALETRVIPLLKFLPESVIGMLYTPLSVSSCFVSLFGEAVAVLLLFLIIFLCRMLSGLHALDRFRVTWLSDIQYIG